MAVARADLVGSTSTFTLCIQLQEIWETRETICYVLAMGKQHQGPHVVVGYGIKIFHYVTDHLVSFGHVVGEHSRPQKPRSFWSAPRIATSSSGQVQRHSGLEWICKHNRLRPEPIRFVRLDSGHEQSDRKSANPGALSIRPKIPEIPGWGTNGTVIFRNFIPKFWVYLARLA